MRASRAALVVTILASVGVHAHEGSASRFTFRDDVRPIFLTRCGGCHQAGGVAPMSLLEYAEAVPWANAIKLQVLDRTMPPWLPEDGAARFQHTRSLTAQEVDVIVDWTLGLTPEGDPLTAAELALPKAADWAMGEPDLILAPTEDVVIGEDDYELAACVVMPLPTSGPTFAEAFEIRPDLSSVLRRATISLGESCDAHPLATWLPGQGSVGLPGDHGQELPAGGRVAVELLYVKGWDDEGKRLVDRSELGIRFSESGSAVARSLEVPTSGHEFQESVALLALYPQPTAPEPSAGEPWTVELIRPGGVVETLLVIERYDRQWREKYVLAEPLQVPAGSRLRTSTLSVWVDFAVAESVAGP